MQRFAHASLMKGDYTSSGTLLRRNVRFDLPLSRRALASARWTGGPGVDEPLVMYTGTGTSAKQYYHTDHQGTVVAMSDGAGALADTYTYTAFGEP